MFQKKKVALLVALVFAVTLLVNPATAGTSPVASFIYTPTAPILGDVTIFNASSSFDPDGGTIESYRWDFDDGTVYTVSDPVTSNNYTAFGSYNVTLTVTDDEAETDTTWQIITVREYPVASFTYTPAIPIVGETATFNASSSNPKGGTIVNYEWDFGDGNGVNVTTQTATYIYTAEGNYNVTLTVTDSENLTDTATKPITIIDYPVAAFTHSPDRPLVNQTVTFDASSSTADGGTIVSYEWDFDDGTNGTGKIATHKYTAFGNRNVTLTVTDTENLTDTAWTIVQVRKTPFATFTYSPAAPLVNEMVTFNASASTPDGGYIANYTWSFGDASPSVTEADPITNHTYTTEGTFNVTLTVTDDDSLTDTTWKLITVYTFLFVHDIAITNVTTSASELYVGQIVNITVVAKNEGNAPETFSVTAKYNATIVGTKTVTYLLENNTVTLTFSLNTSNVTPGNYIVSAEASVVSGETDTGDNTYTDGALLVKGVGDVNGDGEVNILDIVTVALAFDSKPGDPDWNPHADLNYDDVINILDIVICAIHFGETY